ncbi:hypothetical protein RINTHH_5370 [Richelia intracellularis HH01]|uniref:Uncharacterized protein n=1 Tax=Richelia intracellularis HH01 TaxID=1165094 RepID=M1WY70_9NOST|nr:hypothetical protein RINTHH_5370 [Richelia intracellularis HH01]
MVAELQTTQGKLEALIIRNHKITEENKILRQEIDKVIRLGFQLQQRINIHQQNKSSNNPESFPRQWQEKPSTQKSPKPPTKKYTISLLLNPKNMTIPLTLFPL